MCLVENKTIVSFGFFVFPDQRGHDALGALEPFVYSQPSAGQNSSTINNQPSLGMQFLFSKP
jgi:hypothetical protein